MTFVNTEYPQEASRDNILRYFEALDDQELDTGAAPAGVAVNVSTTFNTRFQLMQILIHFDAASSETVTMTFDSRNGTNYDTVITQQALAAATDFVIVGEDGIDIYQLGDEINLQITASAGAPHAYITVLVREIP